MREIVVALEHLEWSGRKGWCGQMAVRVKCWG